MELKLSELQYLKDGDICRQKIDDIITSLEQKGVTVEITPSETVYFKKGTFFFSLGLSIQV
ncbi:MAG: hypothetical protein LBG93_09980 [Treponema sp.]|jgi:hypothetical protein|nr:hypothetical protein [Treponema sp.]